MIIVDSSPVIALLRSEDGGHDVAARIDGGAISAVNYSEVVSRMADLGITEPIWRSGLDSLRLEVVAFDRAMSESAGLLRPRTRHLGLSLGDRACLALAMARGAPVLTAHRAWTGLDIGLDIQLIR
jgi:PIN domain nuclease of toxin-antitoxin system